MQEIINAMLKVILDDGSQAKPVMNSVRRGNDMFVEFHSGYTFYFNEDYIEIINSEKNIKERVRRAPNAKISVGVLRALKDWLNLDFNSGITIEDETDDGENSDGGTSEDGEGSQEEQDSKGSDEDAKETSKDSNEKRKIPSRADVKVKKK